jgi:hypothetical protein
MALALLDYPMTYSRALRVATILKGRLPSILELKKLSFDYSQLKNSLFWTTDQSNKSNVWCVDKQLDIKLVQHRSCEQINTIVIID